jgi:hypothetical protein
LPELELFDGEDEALGRPHSWPDNQLEKPPAWAGAPPSDAMAAAGRRMVASFTD